DQSGNPFDSSSVLGSKVTVVYFYPKDFTPGCSKEACQFRDAYEDFKTIGAQVIGISSDTAASHKKFKQRYQLPFILLSDPKQKVRRLFGVKKHALGLIPGRETFVVDKNGVLRHRYHRLKAEGHVKEALSFVKQLQ